MRISNKRKNFEIDKLLYQGWKNDLSLPDMGVILHQTGYVVHPLDIITYWVQLDDYASKFYQD